MMEGCNSIGLHRVRRLRPEPAERSLCFCHNINGFSTEEVSEQPSGTLTHPANGMSYRQLFAFYQHQRLQRGLEEIGYVVPPSSGPTQSPQEDRHFLVSALLVRGAEATVPFGDA